jgi:raffinose/stachyose/melibiose transport system permease protein
MTSTFRDWKAILVFVGPALLLFTLVMLIPIVWSIGFTFFEGSPIGGFEFVGLDNYLRLIGDGDFHYSLLFTLRYAFTVTSGQILLGLILALFYVFYLQRGSSLVRTLVFFPVVVPTVAIAQLFVKLFEISPQYGLVNAPLALFGGDNLVQPWTGQGDTGFWVIIIMDIWRAMGFYGVLLYAGLIEVPIEVIESARMDGASGLSLIRLIILPLLRPVLTSSLIFSLNGTLKVFDSILALTGGGPGNTTEPLTLYMYKTAFRYNEYGYGSTVVAMLAILSLLVTLVMYRFARRDVA